MSDILFRAHPHIPLLQWLARGSLKQNLLRAIRLWVWLSTIYGDRQTSLDLDRPFTYYNWRDAFFTSSHPKGEAIPHLHDCHCPCAKTTADWLFNSQVSATQWRQALLAHDSVPQLDQILSKRLFGVTRRTLQGDLEILTELGWLEYRQQCYHRVSQLPQYPEENHQDSAPIKSSQYPLNFLHPELANIAQNSREVRGVQRFFLHVDYVISKDTLDLVDDWQDQLCKLWEINPVPPIQLLYQSARMGQTIECIVYPVCIYYVQRAVYLCAFGQTPTQQGEWYNYRLDRILKMQQLDWTEPHLPNCLNQAYPKQLPQPDVIEEKIAQAWGFDFYLEPKWMLLRFEREFNLRYIQETFRHETFESLTYQQAWRFIQQQTTNAPHRHELLTILQSRSPKDAYYRVNYRDGDTNVGLRLRSWRPKGEVIFPWKLRQSLAQEVAEEARLYLN
ncbi:TIGR03985 family CRISPR-associated protein [Kamptonema sp. UHCC 0994]|uniref:TIGR03985 family CRISPR-associated protein n=1 Tax=Kamptonema sp. UHCC 0994 TaxID=3031329 RepID=UPI0023BA815F|nr:TIGR03985 family CRISPR-associated protein [Kamptonema sp. UHCC 0994]MDF0556432.1 TIGR03985 family CRISPR-associated protein [Kamptonema sp. UHCC 0994]